MSNKDIILDSFARLLTNVRENRTFIHSTEQTRKTYRRTRHSQPPPLSQQLFALQRHYLELCNTIAFTPTTTPTTDAQSPSSPRMWTDKRSPKSSLIGRNEVVISSTATPPGDIAENDDDDNNKKEGAASNQLLKGMKWDGENKQWIGNYTDADKFHKFGTIKPVTEENDSLIAKIAEAADMWYDPKEFKWKKRKKKSRNSQKSLVTSSVTSALRSKTKHSPRYSSSGNTSGTSNAPPPPPSSQFPPEEEEEDVFAGISIDVNHVEGDFTKGCFVLSQEMRATFCDAGRRNEEELAGWPEKVDVLTQRYSNANIIRKMAIKKILHDITLASVRTSSSSSSGFGMATSTTSASTSSANITSTATTMVPPPLHLESHLHMSSSSSTTTNTNNQYGNNNNNNNNGSNSNISSSNSNNSINGKQRTTISGSPTSLSTVVTNTFPPVANNSDSPPLHYAPHVILPPSLGNTPTPPPMLSVPPQAPTAPPPKTSTPHRLVLSVRGTKTLTSRKSGSISAGGTAGIPGGGSCCWSSGSGGSSSNQGSKRDSLVLQKFSGESDGDDSDPFENFTDDDDTNTTSSGGGGNSVGNGGFVVRVRHRMDGNGSSDERKNRDGSISSSTETRAVPLQPKGIRFKKLSANKSVSGVDDVDDDDDDDDDDFCMGDAYGRNGGGSSHNGSVKSKGIKVNRIGTNNSNNSGSMQLEIQKFNDDRNDVELDQFSDFDDDDDDDGSSDVEAIVDDVGGFADDDDTIDMFDHKTRSSSCSRSRSTSVNLNSRPRTVIRPLNLGGLKLSVQKFSMDDNDDDDDDDPFADFSDDNDEENKEDNNNGNSNDYNMPTKSGPSITQNVRSPINLFISPRGKGDSQQYSIFNNDHKQKKNVHHFATIRQDGTIVMDDENGDEEVYDPCAGFDDSVIVGYEDTQKNPSECYDDFIDMDDDTDLVLKSRNGGGEFSDDENDEDISGLDLSNVDQLVIHKCSY